MNSLMPWKRPLSLSLFLQTLTFTSRCTSTSFTHALHENVGTQATVQGSKLWDYVSNISIYLTLFTRGNLNSNNRASECVHWTRNWASRHLSFSLMSCRRSSSNVSGFNSEMCSDDQSVGLVLSLKCYLPSLTLFNFLVVGQLPYPIKNSNSDPSNKKTVT